MEYKLVCKQCGKEFYHKTYHKVYCDECSALRHKERNKKFMRRKRGSKAAIYMENKSLSQVIKELETYNKEHGTCISYGQFVAMNR